MSMVSEACLLTLLMLITASQLSHVTDGCSVLSTHSGTERNGAMEGEVRETAGGECKSETQPPAGTAPPTAMALWTSIKSFCDSLEQYH